MVKQKRKASENLDQIFHALSDATRRQILLAIAEKEMTVTELASPFKMSLAAISKHLKVLEKAGLLNRTIDGRVHRCVMNVKPLTAASEVIQQYQAFWTNQLDSLEDFLMKASQVTDETKSKTISNENIGE